MGFLLCGRETVREDKMVEADLVFGEGKGH